MKELDIVSHYSPWFVFLCILVGAGYAYFLYQKNTIWSQRTNWVLAVLRFLVTSSICILLMGIFLNMYQQKYEKPIYAFVVDNSQSITFLKDSTFQQKIKNQLENLNKELQSNDYQVDIYDLNQKQTTFSAIQFNQTSTDLGKSLAQIQSDYENQNLAGVIILSDGICNQGILPTYQTYSFPIYTIGIGDTVIRQDIQLRNLFYNKVSYLNNQFSITAEIQNQGYQGQATQVILKQNDTIIAQQKVTFHEQEGSQKIQFLTTAKKLGKLRYQIEVKALPKELTTNNNVQSAYIDVIEQKEKILLIANAPHPDIKMFKSMIDEQEKYELEVVLLVNQPNFQWKKNQPYSLVIVYQFSQKQEALLRQIEESTDAILHIVGKETHVPTFNKYNGIVQIQQNLPQYDDVHGVGNPTFDKFEFDVEKWVDFVNAPPLQVPFADYQLKNNAEILFFQQLGSVKTSKPLCIFGESNGKKVGTLIGEGFWKWRMFEHLNTNKTVVFDEFFKKYFQLLTVKKDKRKFIVEPKSDEIFESENMAFAIHCYNDIYEEIFNQNVTIKVFDEQNKLSEFHLTTNNLNNFYQLKAFKEGIYKYIASAKIGETTHEVKGSFVVKSMKLEESNLVANFELLQSLATKTQGYFALFGENNEKMIKNILIKQPQELIHSTEQELEIINFQWICYLLIFLISLEWIIRKFMGGY